MPRLNADTLSEPEGITRRVVLSVLEAFFRRPWLHLLPLIVLTAVGVATAFDHDDRYWSVATMSTTDKSLLSDVTATNSAPFTFQSPAQRAAGQLNILLSTELFLRDVAQRAHIPIGGQHDELRLDELGDAIATTVSGDTLVQVVVATHGSELSRALADGTVNAYIDYVATANVQEGRDTEQSIKSLVDAAQADRDAANKAVTDYLAANNDASGPFADPVKARELRVRELEFDQAEKRYSDARAAQDKAGLEEGTASDVVRQRNVLLIPAAAAQRPESSVRGAILTVAVFIVLGLVLTIASAVATAMLDRTIRVPEDIRSRFGLDVLAVVPDVSR